jgi:hypothetical protein
LVLVIIPGFRMGPVGPPPAGSTIYQVGKEASVAKKKAAAKTEEPEQQPAKVSTQTEEPGDINESLSSDRMKALLEDHRKMGSRP